MLHHGSFYHIFNRGNNKENIFVAEENYDYFLDLYMRYVDPVAETFAYCLMRNHFHLLVRIRTMDEQKVFFDSRHGDPSGAGEFRYFVPRDPSRQFSHLFNSYSKAFNKRYGRSGSLFEKPFKRIVVDTESYFTALVHYIHFNPQKHGFTDDFRRYPFSSYGAFLSDKPTHLMRDSVLEWFEGTNGFRAFHERDHDFAVLEDVVGEDIFTDS